MSKYLYLLSTLLFCLTLNAQSGIKVNTANALESYTLLQARNGQHLINNCGEIINSWSTNQVSYHTKLLPNGNLMYIEADANVIVEKDWDGNKVVSKKVNVADLTLIYEIIKMPNGNYLCVARKFISQQEFVNLGWDPALGQPNVVDMVIEFDPELEEIVWEWNIMDHAIQDENDLSSTYGVVEDHPELLDMGALSVYDWTFYESFMINSMDYNPTLDQIALSVRKLGEIVIIDHSTTTEEAAGHTGGNAGKGGDILYRWGNPGNYGRETADQKQELFLQHNPKWITEGPHKGKISIYNNNLGKVFSGVSFSSAYVIDPPMNADGSYVLEPNKPYGPVNPSFKIDQETTGTLFHSEYGSGVQLLPNNNVYISNATGRLMEVNMAGEIQWEYEIPFANFVYRTEKYSKNYIGFSGQDLTNTGIQIDGAIEDESCWVLSEKNEKSPQKQFSISYDGSYNTVYIENLLGENFRYQLSSIDGRALQKHQSQNANAQLDLNPLAPGIYFVTFLNEKGQYQESHKIMRY